MTYRESIRQVLEDRGSLSLPQISAATSIARGPLSRTLAEMRDCNEVRVSGVRRAFVYSVPRRAASSVFDLGRLGTLNFLR